MRRVKLIAIQTVSAVQNLLWRLTRSNQSDPESSESSDDEAIDTNHAKTKHNEPSFHEISTQLRSFLITKENIPKIVIAMFLTMLSIALNYSVSHLMGKAFNSSADERELPPKWDLIVIILLIKAAQLVPTYREQVLTSFATKTTSKILQELAKKNHLEKTLEYHIEASDTDQTFVLNKGFAVSNTITPLLTQILPAMFEIAAASSIIATQYDLGAALFLTLMLASSAGFGVLRAPLVLEMGDKSQKGGKKAWGAASEVVTNYKAIHDSHESSNKLEQVKKGTNRAAKIRAAQLTLDMKNHSGQVFISGLFVITTLLFTDYTSMTKKDLFILTSYLHQLMKLIPAFGQTVSGMMSTYPDIKVVVSELMQPSMVKNHYPDVELRTEKECPPKIEFRNVSFYFDDVQKNVRKTVLNDVSFTIEAGQRIALVSDSGRGKSTLFNLLFRHYEPKSGAICINDQNIWEVGLSHLRDKISIVEQAPVISGNTLRENIIGTRNTKRDEEILAVAKKVGLSDFIVSYGLDTKTGSCGKKLSGGQKQRVGILRAMLRDASILLLDEATAGFDATIASRFMASLQTINKTIMVITHKLSEIADFDKIIVLNNDGSVIVGTHAELLKMSELYKTLWESQMGVHGNYAEGSPRLFSVDSSEQMAAPSTKSSLPSTPSQ